LLLFFQSIEFIHLFLQISKGNSTYEILFSWSWFWCFLTHLLLTWFSSSIIIVWLSILLLSSSILVELVWSTHTHHTWLSSLLHTHTATHLILLERTSVLELWLSVLETSWELTWSSHTSHLLLGWELWHKTTWLWATNISKSSITLWWSSTHWHIISFKRWEIVMTTTEWELLWSWEHTCTTHWSKWHH